MPEKTYHTRCADFARQRDAYAQRWNRVSNLRLLLFLAAVACAATAFWGGLALFWPLAALLAVGFVVAVAYHSWLGRMRQRYQLLWEINDEGLRRLRRDWASLPLRSPAALALPPLAADLDLLGHASLQHLLCTPCTATGQSTLQGWLLAPAPPEALPARRAAVVELAPALDLRDQLGLLGRLMGDAQPGYEQFLAWAEGQPWLAQRLWLLWLTRALTLLTLAALVGYFAGLASPAILVALMLVNVGLTFAYAGGLHGAFDQLSARQAVFEGYAALFDLIAAQPWSSPALRALQTQLGSQAEQVPSLRALRGTSAAGPQMRRLARIVAFAELRASLLYLPIQSLTLLSFHLLWLLERWQRASGAQARAWLSALGEVEALAALATLAYDHPGWAFPEPATGQPLLEGRALGHPLLPPDRVVTNDVTIGPPGTLLLVTGSNMSGKSTLLRAIGLNVALAQAGGPVCAVALRLPPLTLATSVRVQDSLEQGVSYFMAELHRLKQVVDLAEQTRATGARTLLFLLDEILHGTNTAERQIAARRILRHLVDQGAIGAVSTHDLGLADAAELVDALHLVHFSETWASSPNGPQMTFDYTLRPGVATSTNALKLMELIGLPTA